MSAEAVEGTSAAPLLEVRDVEKTFPGVRALSRVSFDVRAVVNGSEIRLGPR
jgi:ABC-type sugar transport system ATPase subunit